MKVLIVDDEPAVKEAMDLLLDWEQFGIDQVLYAENGAEALELLEGNGIDILFCDMQMPVMGGQQLLEELMRRESPVKIIAVSGYNDFQYVRATLLAKGIDYILKPLDEEELQKALRTAIAQRQKEQRQASMLREMERMSEAASLQVLRDWLNGKHKYSAQVAGALQTLRLEGRQLFTAAIVWQNPYKTRNDIFDSDIGNMRKTLNQTIQDALGSSRCILVDLDDYFQIAIIAGKMVNLYPAMLQKFLQETEKDFGLKGIFAFDNKGVGPEGIFQQVEILKYHILSRRAAPKGTGSEAGGRIPAIKSLEPVLLSGIREKKVERIKRAIDDYSDALFRAAGLTCREIQLQTIEFNLMLSRLQHELADSLTDIRPVSVWIFDREIWGDRAQEQLYKIITYGKEETFRIESVCQYLEEHFAENITIGTLTEHFYQSPQYLSKQFKDRYQKTIMNALKEIRICHAKQLLEASSYSVMEIAALTGYEDENYFSKVFRKDTEMSPRNYRSKFQDRR